jgi:hypothetical protein
MYVQVIEHYPALGKGPDLEALLEERVKSASAGGSRAALYVHTVAPEPAYNVAILHENLAAMEAYASRNLADLNFQAWQAKVQSVVSRPSPQELHNVLVRSPGSGNVGFLWSIRFFPVPGQGPTLRRLLEDRINTATSRGANSAWLLSQAFSRDWPNFGMNFGFADLGTMESYQGALQFDSGFQAFSSAVTGLLARPNQAVLRRVLIPFPPD